MKSSPNLAGFQHPDRAASNPQQPPADLRGGGMGQPQGASVHRLRPRRKLGYHDLLGAIDEQVLAMDAHGKQDLWITVDRVPAAAIAHLPADGRERFGPLPGRPCLPVAAGSQIIDDAAWTDLPPTKTPVWGETSTESGKISNGPTEPPGAACESSPIKRERRVADGDLRPQLIAQQVL